MSLRNTSKNNNAKLISGQVDVLSFGRPVSAERTIFTSSLINFCGRGPRSVRRRYWVISYLLLWSSFVCKCPNKVKLFSRRIKRAAYTLFQSKSSTECKYDTAHTHFIRWYWLLIPGDMFNGAHSYMKFWKKW